ncbi:MAG: tRNA uridine-5-carboxymethylaminomethyl(34) synthesis enzyme MnmG [Planctomycetes bacterium]|nr:tRNA uridine-5-carboxymethylaminomethyl(34) synthesis enzyme MnmG [Planctomycetota bacterium]
MSRDAYDVLVIGGGHAGVEAAWAAARLGARTALVTFNHAATGRMSCNPAIGGIGKGQMVREIDALGGLMGLAADEAGIQFRMLNRRKGPAVWAPRAQADRELYSAAVRRHLDSCDNLTVIEGEVAALITRPRGAASSNTAPCQAGIAQVMLADGRSLRAGGVVLTCGTFLRGLMHCGESQQCGGRLGEAAANALSDSLRAIGLRLERLKTGTPPRVLRRTVDFARLQEQPGDSEPVPFSYMTQRLTQPQVCCWLTWTNPGVHELIRANLDRAPMYSGQIRSRGPRYCPSIEDKVVRFADKQRHQIFLEPEGRESELIYVNGIATSLPKDVQQGVVALIEGLERAAVAQWGYAIEYDFVPPQQIDATLMTKRVRGLFLAGQVNGTSGYEEAAGQGLLAGVNAARLVAGAERVTLGRDEAYIGVMVDDLITRGVTEPYRMFTSRAEHRMHLRYDNADERLTPLGRRIGLVDGARWERFRSRSDRLKGMLTAIDRLSWQGRSVRQWLKRPNEEGRWLGEVFPELTAYQREADVWARGLVEVKYAGYIERQRRAIERFHELEDRSIPAGLGYASIPHLRREAVDRWSAVTPRTVGQAARVSGISPSDVTVLLVHLAGRGGDGR